MAARQLRWLLSVEVLLYVGIGLWLVARAGWSSGQAVGLAATLFVAVRLVVVLVSIAFYRAFPSQAAPATSERLGLRRSLMLYASEVAGMILFFVVIQPFERFWLGADRLASVSNGRPPLLLVHGFRCNRGIWFWLRERLESIGWVVATVNLEPPGAGIDAYAPVIARRVEEVLAATGAAQLIMVAHSMGGLAARAYLRRDGNARVAGLITLGSPHRGSRLAALAWGGDGRQMRVGNAWLEALAAPGAVPLPPRCVSIYSRHDNQVMPCECANLPGAENIEVDGVGHLGMMFSPPMLASLQRALDAD
jgi:triacylglycerol lipase